MRAYQECWTACIEMMTPRKKNGADCFCSIANWIRLRWLWFAQALERECPFQLGRH